jgi:SAM-dependent methyltransferase
MGSEGPAMTEESAFRYVGEELDLFSAARCWKAYVAAQIRPFLGAEVLEVGAGIGATTRELCGASQSRWVALEPDASLSGRAAVALKSGALPPVVQVLTGTLEAVEPDQLFDTILYIDVLEHVEDDAGETRRAATHLRAGGFLVVLSPAHQWLFSPFDRAIGHFRRYTARSLKAAAPSHLAVARLRYLDSIGLVASAGNRAFLRQTMPTARQLQLWDRVMVPLSRIADPLLGFSVGKSILAAWRL